MNVKALERISRENKRLMHEKNADYSGSRGDNITRTGLYGVAVRLLDKVERLLNLTDPARGAVPNFESVYDTFRDVSNYGLIGQLLQTGEWSGDSERQGTRAVQVRNLRREGSKRALRAAHAPARGRARVRPRRVPVRRNRR